MRPPAAVSPAARRARRHRRRLHLLRTRAERRAPMHHPNRQEHLPEIGQDDRRLTAVARDLVQPATAHEAPTGYRLRSIPGDGKLLALVQRDDIQALRRLPRGPECVASCRLVTCAQASAGTRDGTAGTTLGQASRTWAVAAAAGLVRRHNPAGQQDRARLVQHPGQGHAVTVLAHL